MKIYIAGKITSEPIDQCVEKFAKVENELRAKGHIARNPLRMLMYELPYDTYMIMDKILISKSDAVYFLKDWKQSKGACEEYQFARLLGKEIMYEV